MSAPSRDVQLELLERMLLVRRFEERAGQMYGMGKIGGFCHLYIGQEAVAVGALSALSPDDDAIDGYREHGHAVARGVAPAKVMAELFGKAGGTSKGKGGSMHLFDRELHFLGGYGIVGGQIALGAGAAFAAKYRGEKRVAMTFFGDAATNQGVFHEVMNMAALWKLPVIFVIENNRYGMGTAVERAMAGSELYRRAEPYQIACEMVDGMDALAVREAAVRAVGRARSEQQPTLIEARTYRYRGHSMADPATYRTKEELEEYRARDPIQRLKATMTEAGLLDDAAWKQMEARVKGQVDAAVAFAESSPEPDLDQIHTDIYQGGN